MYDRGNWCQVWLSMPGGSIKNASLFWFRIASTTGTFPFGTILAADAAAFFASTWGYTSETYQGFAYVHAYLLTSDFGFGLETHGLAAYPGPVPPVQPMQPAIESLVVIPNIGPATRNGRIFNSATPAAWVDGCRPNASAEAWLATLNAGWGAGWHSQGRHFVPVFVSYKNREWWDVEEWRLSPRTGGKRRRMQRRLHPFIGNVPKPLP